MIGDLLLLAAGTLPLWSRPVAMLLALFVLGCFAFIATAGEE